MMLWRNKPDE